MSQPNSGPGAQPVYVIDDSSEMRRSLHALLGTFGYASWPFASAADFLDNLGALDAAPVLLDLRMPRIDGIQLMGELANRTIDWPIIVMSGHSDVAIAVKAMKLGALDFLEKPFEPGALRDALVRAFARLASLSEAEQRRRGALARFARLTRRETDVVGRLTKGLPNKEIASALGLSVRTVEMHRANAMAKLAVRSLPELVVLAADAGEAALP